MTDKKSYPKYTKRRIPPKYIRARIAFASVLLSLICLIGYSVHSCVAQPRPQEPTISANSSVRTPREFPTSDSVTFNGRYQHTFNDMQDVQLEAAMALGIEPIQKHQHVDSLLYNGTLVEVEECLLYKTSEASLPYLIPDAKELLDEIAIRFQQRINAVQPLRLTSCLRTQEFVSKLRRRNRNSVPNSCHLYGTTFDISYRNMLPNEKQILAQVIYELQQAGHCYVKYEYKQPCFHITVRPPQ